MTFSLNIKLTMKCRWSSWRCGAKGRCMARLASLALRRKRGLVCPIHHGFLPCSWKIDCWFDLQVDHQMPVELLALRREVAQRASLLSRYGAENEGWYTQYPNFGF